jgi:hypothetical protein
MHILVDATNSPGTAIHRASHGSASYDELWIYAHNTDVSAVNLTVQWGGIEPSNYITAQIDPSSGFYTVVPGLLLQDNLLVRAFCDVSNKVVINGYVEI